MTANANTTGFKTEKDVYAELPTRLADHTTVAFPKIDQTVRDTAQGPLISTGRPLDVAINGSGYFMVDTPRGLRFTRSGNLKVSNEGILMTKDGYPLVGPGGGQVEFTENDVEIAFRLDGLVTAGAEERGQIGIFVFANEQLLKREGNSLYATDQTPVFSEESQVVQGMLEGSNVNSVTAMTDLINVSRDIEQVAKMQSDYHDMQINVIRSLAKQ